MTAVIALVAFAVCWLALCPLVVVLHRLVRGRLGVLHPDARALLLLSLALLPLGVATLVAVLGFAPAIGGLVVDEHCHPATGCTTHVPVVHSETLYTASLALLTALGSGALLWSVVSKLRRSLRVASSLRYFAEPSEQESFETIESNEQFAYCIGLLRPKVVLSRGLIDRLSRLQLEVVLRHEQAHAARRDNLRLWLTGVALLPLPFVVKQPLLADLAIAGEQACDRAAAAVGGNDLVIETLSALTAGARPRARLALTTFGSPATIATRIDSLRQGQCRQPPDVVSWLGIVAAYAAGAIAATDLVHHGTELVLGWIA